MQAHGEALQKYYDRGKEAAALLEKLFNAKAQLKAKIGRAVEFAVTEFTPVLPKKKDARSQAAAGAGGSMKDTKLPSKSKPAAPAPAAPAADDGDA